jgi:diguanylate cyclase (GGDEF)-like protein
MGDHVLQLISNTLKHMLRDSDYIVRWGGDEFLIILPNLDEPEMKQLQNRLHCALKPLSNVVSLDVSVSIGYAIYPDEGTELNDLIKIADKKMYSDKRGKNGIYRSMQK